MRLYDWNTKFDFGKYSGKRFEEVFNESPNYISWCFQKVEWFCITDDIFNELPVIKIYKNMKSSNSDNRFINEVIDEFKNLTYDPLVKLHNDKSNKYNSHNRFYDSPRPLEDLDDDWLRSAAGTDDPETMNDVYWNLD